MRAMILGLVLASAAAWGGEVRIVAHRGASHDAPENTLAAFRLAWEQGADAIECDVRTTRDGKLICLHDASLQRTAGLKANVADLAFDQVRALDAGSWKNPKFKGEKVPTLEEVLAVVPPGKRILVEIKVGPEVVSQVKKAVAASGLKAEQMTIIAFDEKVVTATRQAMPTIACYWLYGFKKKDGAWSATHDQLLATLKKTRAHGLDVSYTAEAREVVNRDLARRLSEAGLELHVWTVDDVALAKQAVEVGVGSITTNRPAWLRQGISEK